MKVRTARKLILATIALIVAGQVLSWLSEFFGKIPALLTGGLFLVAQLICSRWAGANLRYWGYMLLPTLLFTIVPAAFKMRSLWAGEERSFIARLWVSSPPLIGVVLPVVLLLGVFFGLKSKESAGIVRPPVRKPIQPGRKAIE